MGIYIIAEVGPNHNSRLDLAKRYIETLSKIGADAVKFQISIPDNVYSKDAFKALYQLSNDRCKTPMEMSKKYQLSYKEHTELYQACLKNKVDYLCSAFDLESLRFIDESFDLRFFKIPSGEMFSLDMIDYISRRNKPVILSTGMATYAEISKALTLLNKNIKKDVTLLHCVSVYPAPYAQVNLKVIQELKKRFGCAVGFSDHTLGIECAIAAVGMGAQVIEKHVTFDRDMEGPDHKASATISEFENLVKCIRNIELAIGNGKKEISVQEREISAAARKSIVSKKRIKKGTVITKEDIYYKRPGTGFLPIEQKKVIGAKALFDIEADKVIQRDHIG